jgi:putative transposase
VETTNRPTTYEYQRDEHRVHLILYHLIWCPKRRKPLLTGKIKERCQELLQEKCQEKGWHIAELAIQPDHIHVFVRVYPSVSAAEVVKELKGITSFHLRKEFKPILSKLPSLWTRSYFAATVGSVSAEGIAAYIEAQKGV